MAEPVPAGSDVSAGTYECTNCGNQIDLGSSDSLPPCPECQNGPWDTGGGDSVEDPLLTGGRARSLLAGRLSALVPRLRS